jgi:hypothetical protein
MCSKYGTARGARRSGERAVNVIIIACSGNGGFYFLFECNVCNEAGHMFISLHCYCYSARLLQPAPAPAYATRERKSKKRASEREV